MPLVRRALAIHEGGLGLDPPDLVTWLNWAALLLQSTNRVGEAEEYYRRALKILETSPGADQPNTATVRRNLAALEAARLSTTRNEQPKGGHLSPLLVWGLWGLLLIALMSVRSCGG